MDPVYFYPILSSFPPNTTAALKYRVFRYLIVFWRHIFITLKLTQSYRDILWVTVVFRHVFRRRRCSRRGSSAHRATWHSATSQRSTLTTWRRMREATDPGDQSIPTHDTRASTVDANSRLSNTWKYIWVQFTVWVTSPSFSVTDAPRYWKPRAHSRDTWH